MFEIWSLLDSRRKKPELCEYKNMEPGEAVSTTNLNALKNTSAFMETYTVGISSSRVLNLVYSSETDLKEETNPLLGQGPSLISAAA